MAATVLAGVEEQVLLAPTDRSTLSEDSNRWRSTSPSARVAPLPARHPLDRHSRRLHLLAQSRRLMAAAPSTLTFDCPTSISYYSTN